MRAVEGRHPGGAFFILLLLLIGLALYWAGLSGRFHLDDLPNLGPLESDKLRLWQYLLNAPVGGSGRPLAYLSFYLQRAAYPDAPGQFLAANLGIHLLNALLLYWLVYGLARVRGLSRPERLAFFVALLWMMLPIQVSSVLYAVQRMTLLSATLVLAGLAGYVQVRRTGDRWRRGTAWRLTAWAGLAYLGVLAKENAILAGLALALLEYFFLSRRCFPLPRWWRGLVFFGPFAVLLYYLFVTTDVVHAYGGRDFTFEQRLLSESRILWDYLKLVLVPDLNDLALYHDDFPVSRGLGIREAVALGGWALVLVLILAWRRSRWGWPLSFGLAWFLAMHLLESTVVPLELYFEHRNYLPSVGLAIGLGFAVHGWLTALPRLQQRRILQFVAGLYLGWLGLVTFIEARTWGDPLRFVAETRYKHPGSVRAMQELAAFLAARGNFQEAYRLHADWIRDHPDQYSPGLDLRIMMLSCYDQRIPFRWGPELAERFRTGRLDLSVQVIQDVLDHKLEGKCGHISWEAFIDVIDALLANPRYRHHGKVASYLRRFRSFAYLALKEPEQALQSATEGVDLRHARFDYLTMVATLADEAEDRSVFDRVMALIEKKRPPDFMLEEGQIDLLQRLERAAQRR